MNDSDLFKRHIMNLASACEIRSRQKEDPEKAFWVGQAKGLMESLKIFDEYNKMDIPDVQSIIGNMMMARPL